MEETLARRENRRKSYLSEEEVRILPVIVRHPPRERWSLTSLSTSPSFHDDFSTRELVSWQTAFSNVHNFVERENYSLFNRDLCLPRDFLVHGIYHYA